MNVSQSVYYKWLHAETSQQEQHKAFVLERITYHYHDNLGRYSNGSPKISYMLSLEGIKTCERTNSTYM
ncbi:hypothetical protein [Paenibacillus sp. L3-i20]|uniref:hypothetical protein n=1 Tax=Paenibacillus sp. L3-i20 TaxID=2905833 RepID=UPI001EDF1EB9|nr:hypothetical protein [Paenibacillus sp. L3-i20]